MLFFFTVSTGREGGEEKGEKERELKQMAEVKGTDLREGAFE